MKNASSIDFTQSLFDDGEFYKVIQTKMGQHIWCMMRSDVQSVTALPNLTLVRPVMAVQLTELRQKDDPNVIYEGWALRPWMGPSSSEEFVVGTEIFMTIGTLSERCQEQYKEHILKMRMLEEAQKLADEERKRDAALTALLLSISTSGEVTFLNDGDV